MTEENNVVEKLTPEQQKAVEQEIEKLIKGGLSQENAQEQANKDLPKTQPDQSQSH